MGTEDSKDLLKGVDWKTVGTTDPNEPVGPVTKKRIPKRIRQVPEYYFLPRQSLPSAIAIYGAVIAAGVGAGMLAEVWINKKIKGVHSHVLKIHLLYLFLLFCFMRVYLKRNILYRRGWWRLMGVAQILKASYTDVAERWLFRM